MLAKRIIPCLDVKDGRVVKGVKFVDLRDAGDPVEAARAYDAQGADELVFLDITASHEDRSIMLDVVRRTADVLYIPFTVGGGVRTVDDVRVLLRAGAEKVSFNTAALARPLVLRDALRDTPPSDEKLNASSEAPKNSEYVESVGSRPLGKTGHGSLPVAFEDHWGVYTHGGRRPTGRDAVAWAQEAVELGAGEILLTSMDRDGTKDGYDLALTRAIADAVTVPVIASGGAGTLEHFREAFVEGDASGALAASLFHFGTYTIAEVKAHLAQHGVEVRV